jgi:hypothetical protein
MASLGGMVVQASLKIALVSLPQTGYAAVLFRLKQWGVNP